MKLIGSRFVRFLWSVLPNTGILYSSLCQPAKVTFMDESASPVVTLHISSSPLRQSTLLFSNFFSCSLSFISPCFSLSLRLPDSHLPSHPSHGDYVSWRQGLRIRRWPQFSAHFPHENLKELRERQGSGQHRRTFRNTRSQPETVPERAAWLEISQGKGMMGFFCFGQSYFPQLNRWMCHSCGSQSGSHWRVQGKTATFITKRELHLLPFNFWWNICSVLQVLITQHSLEGSESV